MLNILVDGQVGQLVRHVLRLNVFEVQYLWVLAWREGGDPE